MPAPPESRACLDIEAVLAAVPNACDTGGVNNQLELARMLGDALKKADTRLAERFWSAKPPGNNVVDLVSERAWAVEQLLLLAWRSVVADRSDICLVAVGGYGRGELHPGSDVDLLILLGSEDAGTAARADIEAFVQVLWDAGFYLGHSVRTVDDCISEARDDVTTATTLMETRLLAGPASLYQDMVRATGPDRLWSARAFFEAKMEEQSSRHARFNDTAYNLEPNIKEGPGGLRDIQMISWVARRHFGTSGLDGLVDHDFLTGPELGALRQGQVFLWTVRFALHLLAGRAEDRLLFDHQRDIATWLEFEDVDGNLAVEQFMQKYYRTVMRLERLNERLLQLFQEELLYPGQAEVVSLGADFRLRNGFLEVVDDELFIRKPTSLMKLFVVLARDPEIRGVRASTIRLIRQHRYEINDEVRAGRLIHFYFLTLLRQSQGVYSQLLRMNRYGVLAAYLPVFGKIVGRMQYDLFHVYTVDQHTLFVVRNLRRFAYGKYRDLFPHVQSVFRRIGRPELLYLAAIFHDIAKGRGGDHSTLGAADALEYCQAIGLEPGESQLVSWLVEQHLMMSRTAQQKDLSDPSTIHEFAMKVGDKRYLDYLYLLTVADIQATSPKLWNSWKNSLLWELYLACGRAIRRGLHNPVLRETRIREKRSGTFSRLIRKGLAPMRIGRLWKVLPESTFLRFNPSQLEWVTEVMLAGEGRREAIVIREARPHRVSELLVCVPDHDGLFAAITRVLDEMGTNVLAAKVLTTLDGRSFDLFTLMDRHNNVLNEADCEEMIQRLEVACRDEAPADPVRRAMPRRLKHFVSEPSIAFVDGETESGTILEFESNDRPGLLSRIAAAITACGLQVHDARIATFGERVEDTFVISEPGHRPLSDEVRERLKKTIRKHLE